MNRTNTKAFTITELMMTVLIAGFVSGALALFMMDSAKAIYSSSYQSDVSNNMRQFIGEMESVGRSANVCYVYKSFNATDRASSSNRLSTGQSGDFVMFVTTVPDGNMSGGSYLNHDDIIGIVGYFRRPDATGKGPVYKFSLSYPSGKSASTYTPEALISALSYSGTYSYVLQYAQGGFTNGLFYCYETSGVMVSANVYAGTGSKQVSNFFNFTISPRG
jgi:Tfp pilus assembly protein PilE